MRIWEQIAGMEGFYEVSTCGQIRSMDRTVNCSRGNKTRLKSGKLLKQGLAGKGYLSVNVSIEGKVTRYNVHRLVAKTFIPNPHKLAVVDHIDGDKTNNNVTNLEWVTYAQNNERAFALGIKSPSGPISKLTPQQADELRQRYSTGGVSQRALAKEYGVSHGVICRILHRKTLI